MKKLLIPCKRCAVLLLALTAAFAVSCTGDLEKDVTDNGDRLDKIESVLGSALDDGKLVTAVTPDGDGTYTVTFSDGTSAPLDGEIIDQCAEFYVFELNGEQMVAYKYGVAYPESLSLRGNEVVSPYLVKGETYTFTVQVNPTDEVVTPTDFYLVEVEGQTKASQIAPAYEQLQLVEWKKSESGYANAYDLSVEYLSNEPADAGQLAITVEFEKNSWDAANSEIVTKKHEVLSATTLANTPMNVFIQNSDVVQPLGKDDENTPIVINLYENETKKIDLEQYFQNDFISANVQTVAIIPAANMGGDFFYGSNLFADGAYNFGDLELTPTPTPTSGSVNWTSRGDYSNATGTDAILKVQAPKITGNDVKLTYEAAFFVDDYKVNTEKGLYPYYKADNTPDGERYYTDVFGTNDLMVKEWAGEDEDVIKGYVMREVTFNVYNVNEYSADVVNAFIPAGSTDYVYKSDRYELTEYDSYAVDTDNIKVKYTRTDATYGYTLSKETSDSYTKYLQSKIADIVYARVDKTADAQTDDFYYELTLANVEDMPVLPGSYEFTIPVTMSNEDEFTNKALYKVTVNLYAPQYTVNMQSTILADGNYYYPEYYNGSNWSNGNVHTAASTTAQPFSSHENNYPETYDGSVEDYGKLMTFSTYDYYDFDIVRLVNVGVIDSWSMLNKPFDFDIKSNPNRPTSVQYNVNALAACDTENLVFNPTAATESVPSTEVKWDVRLYADVDGQDAASNLVDVQPIAAGSKDVEKKVTLYTVLESGLKIPVQLMKSTYEGKGVSPSAASSVVPMAHKGSFVVKVGINGLSDSASALANDFDSAYDYTATLKSAEDADKTYKTDKVIALSGLAREIPVFQNLLKDNFKYQHGTQGTNVFAAQLFTDYATNVLKYTKTDAATLLATGYNGTWNFTTTILTSDVAYSDEVVKTLKADFITYANTVDVSSVGKNYAVLYGALSAESNTNVTNLYCTAYANDYKKAKGTDSVYEETAKAEKVGEKQAQIGNASSDLKSTVNLIASTTYEVGKLYTCTAKKDTEVEDGDLLFGKKYIDVVDGVIYKTYPNNSTFSGKVYAHDVKVTVTDVAGNKAEATTKVYFEF